jgi:hypothetical protein
MQWYDWTNSENVNKNQNLQISFDWTVYELILSLTSHNLYFYRHLELKKSFHKLSYQFNNIYFTSIL